jgi:hypothetical protein
LRLGAQRTNFSDDRAATSLCALLTPGPPVGTLISLTKQPMPEVMNPIYDRLEDEQSLLRRSGDVSMLAEALLDVSKCDGCLHFPAPLPRCPAASRSPSCSQVGVISYGCRCNDPRVAR